MAQEEGYFYFIMNLKLLPVKASEDCPYSPFSNVIDDLRKVIYNFLIQYHPVLKDEEYDEETYQIDCDLYTWLLKNYKEAIEQLDNFSSAIECILGSDNEYYGNDEPFEPVINTDPEEDNDEDDNTDENENNDEPENTEEEPEETPERPHYSGITEDMTDEEINEIIEMANSFIEGTVFDNFLHHTIHLLLQDGIV
jgi:hypothetical protein